MLSLISPVYAQITNPALKQFGSSPSEGGQGFAFYISQLWKAIVIVGGLAFLLYFVWGALEWIIGGDDKAKVEQAQKKMTNGFIGLVLLVASFAIVLFLQEVLQFDILNIDWTFSN